MPTTTTTANIIVPGTSVAAGGTKAAPVAAGQGATVNVTGHYGGEIYAKVANGATGPTAPGIISIYFSPDGSDWYEIMPVTGSLTNGDTQSVPIPLDTGVKYVRGDAYGNTGQSVTVSLVITYITAP